MKNFRDYLWHRFLLENVPLRLYDPEGTSPKPKPDMGFISKIIHYIPVSTGVGILEKLKIKRKLPKTSLTKFKYALAAAVAGKADPELVQTILSVSTTDLFGPLIDFWKSVAPATHKEVLPKEIDIHPLDVKPDESEKPVSTAKNDTSIRLQRLISHDENGPRFVYSVMAHLLHIGYKPQRLQIPEQKWVALQNFVHNPNQELQKLYYLYTQEALHDLASGNINANILSKLVDNLDRDRIAQIRIDELEVLAYLLYKTMNNNGAVPQVKPALIQQLIAKIGEKRYHGE